MSSAQVALSNHLIRQNIFKYLDYVDLSTCSLVTKTWAEEIKFQFGQKIPKFIIHLHYCTQEYCGVDWKKSRKLLVEEIRKNNNNSNNNDQDTNILLHLTFEQILSKLVSIPYKRIWLDCQFCCLSSLEQFALIFQNSITHLTYGHHPHQKSGQHNQQQKLKKRSNINILKFIHKNLPHLEYLCFNQPQEIDPRWARLCHSHSSSSSGQPTPQATLHFERLQILKLDGPDWCEEKELDMNSVFPWSFIQTILKSSPNLTKIFGFPLKSIHCLSSDDLNFEKMIVSKIRSLCYEFDGQLEGLRNFSGEASTLDKLEGWLSTTTTSSNLHHAIQLEELNLRLDLTGKNQQQKFRQKHILTQLLKSSAHVLRKLTLAPTSSDHVIHENEDKIIKLPPILDRVDTVEFHGDKFYWMENETGGELSFYEPGQNLSTIFPNVTHILVSVSISPFFSHRDYERQLESFRTFFPSKNQSDNNNNLTTGQILSSVHHLTLDRCLPTICLAELSMMMPEVERIVLNFNYTGMRLNLADCCQLWPGLEEITIQFDVASIEEDEEEDEEEIFWDSWLTGFSEEICQEIREDPLIVIPPDLAEECRIYDSICDLESMKLLKFKFTPCDDLNDENYPRIFSQVTGLYAFGMRPNMKVMVDVDYSKFNGDFKCIKGLRRMLEPIAAHVFINF